MPIQKKHAALLTGAIPLGIGLFILTLDVDALYGLAVIAVAPAVAIRNGAAGNRRKLSNLPITNYDLYDTLRALSLAVALALFAAAILPGVLR